MSFFKSQKLIEQEKHPNLLKQGRHLYSAEKKIVFGFTPKAGCTLVSKLFFKTIGELDEALETGSLTHKYRNEHIKKNPITFEVFNKKEILKIKFVRNPYQRVVSSFFHAVKHEVIKKEAKELFDIDKLPKLNFLQFLQILESFNLNRCDPHLGLQCLPGENNLFYFDEIIKIENLEVKLESIKEKYGVSIRIDENILNSKHHLKKEYLSTEFAGLKAYKDFKMASSNKVILPDYDCFFNAEIMIKVNLLFKKDFIKYDYPIKKATID